MAGEDERALIRMELVPDTREAVPSYQATLTPARRSFPTQTPSPSFVMSQNLHGSVTLEHPSINIRILDTLTMDCENSESMRDIPLVQGIPRCISTCDHGESMRDIPLVQTSMLW